MNDQPSLKRKIECGAIEKRFAFYDKLTDLALSLNDGPNPDLTMAAIRQELKLLGYEHLVNKFYDHEYKKMKEFAKKQVKKIKDSE